MNGKLRDRIEAGADAAEEELLRLARASEKVARHIDGKQVVKEIVVPGKLVNLVVRVSAARHARFSGALLEVRAVLVRRLTRRPSTSGTASAPTSSWTRGSSARETCR